MEGSGLRDTRPCLKRFDIYVYDFVEGQDALGPVSGALITFYAAGATVNNPSGVNLWPGASYDALDVYRCGSFDPGDYVLGQINGPDLGPLVQVKQSDGGYTLDVRNPDMFSITISNGDRLWNISQAILGYADPFGSQSIDMFMTDESGRAACYVRDWRYDFVITLPSGEKRVFVDMEGSYIMR